MSRGEPIKEKQKFKINTQYLLGILPKNERKN